MSIYFILWAIIQCSIIHSFDQIVPALAFGALSGWLRCPLDAHSSPLYFALVLQDALGLFIFLAAALKSAISLRTPGSFFFLENGF